MFHSRLQKNIYSTKKKVKFGGGGNIIKSLNNCCLDEKIKSCNCSTFLFFSRSPNLFSFRKLENTHSIWYPEGLSLFPICFTFLSFYQQVKVSPPLENVYGMGRAILFSPKLFEKPPMDLVRKQFLKRQLGKITKLDRCSVCFLPIQNKKHLIFNEISIECSLCQLKIHPTCYGIQVLKLENKTYWKCDKCSKSSKEIFCLICKKTTKGAMKRTIGNDWLHVTCGLWTDKLDDISKSEKKVSSKLLTCKRKTCKYCGEASNYFKKK